MFRAEQDRQQFADRPRRMAIDVFGQLLRPCLGLHVATALEPTAAFFRAATGVRVPSVPSLGGLVETLLTPPSDRDPLGEPVPVPELAPPSRTRSAPTGGLRSRRRCPRRGGRRAAVPPAGDRQGADPDLPQLVALRVVHAVGSAIGTARSQGDDAVLLAVDDGTVLLDAEYGGADLLVGTAGVL